MQDHPQIKAFNDAASMLRAERYWDYGSRDEHVEFLRALGEVLTEVCYHLNVNDVLPVRRPAEFLLLTHLDRRIEQLIAAPDDSRNTGQGG